MSGLIQTIPWNTLQVEKLIGHGGYGEVFKGSWYGKQVAIKKLILKKLPEHLIKDFQTESKIMAQCKCAQVINLLGICIEDGNYAMIMDYMAKGSLYKVLHDEQEELPWNPIRFRIAVDIGKGLAYLHSQNILHRDLKSLNVLLDQNYNAKITDFGLAKIKLETTSTSTVSTQSTGTTRWLAPELLKRNGKPSFQSDIYAAGMVLWELASRKIPFSDANNEQVIVSWIKDGEQESIPDDCSEKFSTIIKNCWELVPEKRPSAEQLVAGLEQAAPQVETSTEKVWMAEVDTHNLPPGQKYYLIPASPSDQQKVLQFYSHHPIPGYEIASVRVIYNPNLISAFQSHLEKLQERSESAAFDPKWQWEIGNVNWRKSIDNLFHQMAKPYSDPAVPHVKFLPLWHGTDPAIVDSICRVGYANLSTTDSGFFGRGLYSAHEAEYAHRVYSKGALILNWVAVYSPYPVIDGDISKLIGKPNYENYDAHFAPVSPKNPNNPMEKDYYPCAPNTKPTYHEVVVFESAACLPSYVIELKKSVGRDLPQGVSEGKKLPPPPPAKRSSYAIPDQPVAKPIGITRTPTINSQSPAPYNAYSNSLTRSSFTNDPPVRIGSAIGVNPSPIRSSLANETATPHFSQHSSPSRTSYVNDTHSSSESTSSLGRSSPHHSGTSIGAKPTLSALSRTSTAREASLTPEAEYLLGIKLYNGVDVKQNYEKSAEHLLRAADQGYAPAQFKIGICYRSGNLGVPKDSEKEKYYLNKAFEQGVIAYFQSSAAQGNVLDQNHLGLCYQQGLGVTQDHQKAFRYFKLAADKGDPGAQNNLGLCHDQGLGIPANHAEAIKLFTLAAAKGNANAQYNLAIGYENGQGITKDLQKAFDLYTLSAEQGNSYALNNLAVFYKNGIVVEQDLTKAFNLFKQAAEQGNANAQYNVGVCYEIGQGITQDTNTALTYFTLAAKQDDPKAKEKIAKLGKRDSSATKLKNLISNIKK